MDGDPRGVKRLAGDERSLSPGASPQRLADDRSESDEECLHEHGLPRNTVIASGKAVRLLRLINQESFFSANVQTDSVYGAAIALPQIARSGGWPVTFNVMMGRTYFNLFLNYVVQLLLIYVIFQESMVFDPLAGNMNLCSFGNSFSKCPDAKNCRGPGGTNYTQANLIADFGDWSARTFFRDTLLGLHPNDTVTQAEIHAKADPGEFGLESPIARWVCLFVFTMAIANDFQQILEALWMLYIVPTKAESWIAHEPPNELAIEHLGDPDSKEALENKLKFKIAGMSRGWKIVNFFIVVVAKFIIWFLILIAGCNFLFQTPDIVDLVLNSLAMTFILDLDELILTRLTQDAGIYVLGAIEAYQPPRCKRVLAKIEKEDDDDAIQAHREDHFKCYDLLNILPKRFIYVVISMICGYLLYFHTYCQQTEDGSWISKTVYAPDRVYFNPFNAIFHTMKLESKPSWQMPTPKGW